MYFELHVSSHVCQKRLHASTTIKSCHLQKKDRFVNIWCREVDSYLTFWYKRNHVSRISTTTQPELNKIGFTLRVTVQSLYSINLFNGAPLGLCNLSKLWNPIFPFSSRFSHKMHSSHFYADTAWLCENRGTEKEVSFGIFNLIHQRPRQQNSFVEVIARSVHVRQE